MSNLPKNIQTYIDLVYTQKSELNTIQNLDERKVEACRRAKLDPKDEKVQNLMQMKDLIANEQIFDRLISQNPDEYVLYIADKHLYGELIKKIMAPLEANDSDVTLKTKASKEADQLLERLNARAVKIWGAEAEITMATTKIRMMRPEERLRKKSA